MSGKPYRLLVTGSRDWEDDRLIRKMLAAVWVGCDARPLVIVHGHCPTGADATADDWATSTRPRFDGVTSERHPARWRADDGRIDRGAGFRRNAEMVAAGAELVLAFIRHSSPGATHCLELAEKAGIPSRVWRRP